MVGFGGVAFSVEFESVISAYKQTKMRGMAGWGGALDENEYDCPQN